MYVESVRCRNFRNLAEAIFVPGQRLNLLVGDNGQGKTNLLEALYLFVGGKSFRALRSDEMIRWDKHSAEIVVRVKRSEVTHVFQASITREGRSFMVNGSPVKKIADMLGYFNAILFIPDDLVLVKGSPGQRRQFLDVEISQVNPRYYTLVRDYNKAVSNRNELLREMNTSTLHHAMLEVMDENIVKLGSKIIERRLQVLYKLALLAKLAHRQLTSREENLQVYYQSSLGFASDVSNLQLGPSEIEQYFYRALRESRQEELRRMVTLVGPHRDDFTFVVNGKDMRRFGSQGQQRTVVLSLKLAEVEFMKSETGELPVLLLDDVLSELDHSRRATLIDAVAGKLQTIVTATDPHVFTPDFRKRSKLFLVAKGQVVESTAEVV